MVLIIGYCSLRFICNLVLVIWCLKYGIWSPGRFYTDSSFQYSNTPLLLFKTAIWVLTLRFFDTKIAVS